ncbi:hypothetical protein LguiB_002269 [Lonicera macranthoides]
MRPQYSPYPSQLALPEQRRHIYMEHNYTYSSPPPPLPPPPPYNYACGGYYQYWLAYQYPYSLYQYQSQPQLDLGTSSSNFTPTVQYSHGRTYVQFSYPEPMTIILDEDGEIVDDYSQFYDENKLRKELIAREQTILKCLKTKTHLNSKDHDKSEEPDICVICQAEYEDNERIGILECGHEYHGDCIKKWLLQNTVCPICKTTALATMN